MFQLAVLLVFIASAFSAEISSHMDKIPYKPDIAIETHAINSVPSKPELENHPIYRSEEHRITGRSRIDSVHQGNVAKHDMLADQPSPSTDLSKIDKSYTFSDPVEVAYPDIPYAPGYGYPGSYSANSYDMYGNSPADYYMEPDTSAFGLLWSQVPNSRTLVSYAGRTIAWFFSSIFVLLIGSALTVGICTYTNLCKITFNGVGPIHEEMRSLITPERLDKISHAADFVKTAIDKYQKIQKVEPGTRKRRAFYY